ncbi:MAG: nitrogenase molybdenum-iron protein alpha chain [Spirochaetia bacterium]|nr:nitrogenase molybdenum-iron protein alpha chain [Spirochaetia bacterium]
MIAIEDGKKIIEDVLKAYPEKTKAKREKHLAVHQDDCSTCGVKSNVKSAPGVMTARGCAYAGSKGVVWGPIKDVVHISHGPVGCGHYSWSTRRNLADGIPGVNNFVPFHFTSDFQERDIVFGGDKKLEKIIHEINELFPLNNGLSIQSECPVGLIGDDIEAVAKQTSKDIGKPVVPVRCEGFRGVSQSLGHHIANDSIRDHIIGTKKLDNKSKYDIALIGDYNIGGDAWEAKKLLEEVGLKVRSIWSGDATLEMLQTAPDVKLNVIHCYRSMNYICRHMEETYGIPWVEINLFGPTKVAESLRKLGELFDESIKSNVEKAIEKNMIAMNKTIEKFKPRVGGKKVMLYVGGLRPRHTIGAFEDLGMEVVGTGYEFGHKDDYERTKDYIKDGVVIYDDVTAYEFEEFVKKINPDLVASGIKEKYVFQKMGKPFRQMHSWDYSGPYHGWGGFEIFSRDMDMALNSPTWQLVTPKWRKGST